MCADYKLGPGLLREKTVRKKISPKGASMVSPKARSLVISELALRQFVGWIGFLLPVTVAVAANFQMHPSISQFYYADPNTYLARNVFVASMAAMGIFLVCYRGWDMDNFFCNCAGFCAIVVALLQCSDSNNATGWEGLRGDLHLIFAGVFLFILAGLSLFSFTKTDPTQTMTDQKISRNHIYRACGVIMLACLVAIGCYKGLYDDNDAPSHRNVLFILESIAVFAFGIAALIFFQFTGKSTLRSRTPVPQQLLQGLFIYYLGTLFGLCFLKLFAAIRIPADSEGSGTCL